MLADEARTIAERLLERLRPVSERIEIAGSLRRGRPEVKDIEICAVPAAGAVLLGDPEPDFDTFWAVCDRLDDFLVIDYEVLRQGERYRRFITKAFPSPVTIEIFTSEPDSWGNTFAIRTGSGKWNRVLFTQKLQGGLCPRGLQQKDGYLWSWGEKLPCPDEETFFAAFGVPCLPPAQRTEERAKALAMQLRSGG